MNWRVVGKSSLAAAVVVAGLLFSLFATYRYDAIVADVRSEHAVQQLAIEAAKELPPEARTAVLLELQIVERRYDQADAAMLSKLWTRNMGFVIGMLLALIGAAFVIGELRVDPAKISGGTGQLQLAISSSSPGLMLSGFGVVLIIVSLSITYRVDAKDVPVYFRQVVTEGDDNPPPPTFPSSASKGDAVDEAQKKIRETLAN